MAKKNDNWMQTLWRPMMGWMYMLICLLDMAVFPVLWALWQGVNHVPITQWNPLTLQGAGLFHIAMGAVLGISAFGRTQEKLAGTAANPTATSQTITNNNNMSGNVAGGFGSNQGGMGGMGGGFGGQQSGGFGSSMGGGSTFGAPASGGFGSTSGGFGSTTPSTPSSFGGGGFGSTPSATTTPASTGGFGSGFNSGSGATPAPQAPAVEVTAKGHKKVPPADQPAL
jgi:Holin of 3TMs, for gene-transfer release